MTPAERAMMEAARDALRGLEDRKEVGRFCEHAAAPCDRCIAAGRALARLDAALAPALSTVEWVLTGNIWVAFAGRFALFVRQERETFVWWLADAGGVIPGMNTTATLDDAKAAALAAAGVAK